MKRFLIILPLFIILSCTFKDKPLKKRENELAIFVFLLKENQKADNKITLYRNDSLIFNDYFIEGHLTTLSNSMYITNIKKADSTKLRLMYGLRETTIIINTLNIDSLNMSFHGTNGFTIVDNHNKWGWLME